MISRMNQSLFLHLVERLEGFLHRLPVSIQKPVLHELTPLKQLFLQQRAPRFVLTGSSKMPVQQIIATLFRAGGAEEPSNVLMEIFRWHTINVNGHGRIALLDARGADANAINGIREELRQGSADIFFHISNDDDRTIGKTEIENLTKLLDSNDIVRTGAKIIGILIVQRKRRANESRGVMHQSDRLSKLETALQSKPFLRDRVIEITQLSVSPESLPGSADSREFLRQLVGHLPNETRIEMVRISRDREAQAQIAQMFVKSTSAICTAIGTQPIPLADLPILTTLQLLMVSGIMHISGREKNLRAATEFIGALGVNIGAGMVLREGTRALLKFLPGWGNVLCGMVAGAGTYAIGRAAVVYFIEGMSLRDARLTYLSNRKKRTRAKLPERTPALMPE